MTNYKSLIREIPDFPKAGISFKDITPLLANPAAITQVIKDMVEPFKDDRVDCVAAIEARGYIFGASVAYELGVGFIPIRKAGKLPAETVRVDYSLEYGTASLEAHVDAIGTGQRVLVVDDILATGGTIVATIKLLEQLGAVIVGVVVLGNLTDLEGYKNLEGYKLISLLNM